MNLNKCIKCNGNPYYHRIDMDLNVSYHRISCFELKCNNFILISVSEIPDKQKSSEALETIWNKQNPSKG